LYRPPITAIFVYKGKVLDTKTKDGLKCTRLEYNYGLKNGMKIEFLSIFVKRYYTSRSKKYIIINLNQWF